ncbi:putative cyclase-domain-containing protein [Tricladium varicosporioides]|nr:putative cyclase-domain-containing protein [Hymenoscyphus varicosporioides]
MPTPDVTSLPKWKDLPPVPGMPQGTVWGLFDTPSTSTSSAKKDSLGTLNLLTPDVARAASSEIKTGKSVSLNWGLENLSCPGFGRKKLAHTFVDWRTNTRISGEDLPKYEWKEAEGKGFYTYDDEVGFNTQCGSQWDGLRHWGHSKTGLYYNGLRHEEVLKSGMLGMEHINNRGGIVTRGVLLDYVSFSTRHNISYSPMSRHPISLSTLLNIAAESNVQIRKGDIVLVRTGWTKWYEEHSEEERERWITNGSAWVGVDGGQEVVEWLWDEGIAAVAGDSIGWEVWPPASDDWRLHDHLLSMMGMPIGEMWDLEALARECEVQNRWSFFLTSSPLNVTDGVASPPNALAIF